MYITSLFTKNGEGVTGLSPRICIVDIDAGTCTAESALMEELKFGYYRYNAKELERNKNYAIRCDAGSTLGGNERYMYQIIEVDRHRGVNEK